MDKKIKIIFFIDFTNYFIYLGTTLEHDNMQFLVKTRNRSCIAVIGIKYKYINADYITNLGKGLK